MHFILESVLVGCYTYLLYNIASYFLITNIPVILIIVGFFKHILGYYLGIWDWYCKHSNIYVYKLNSCKCTTNIYNLVLESILESIIFLLFGLTLHLFILNTNMLFILLGVFIHILSEITNVHAVFLKTHCNLQ